MARQQYEALDPKPRFTDAPKQPSPAERKLHEVTHLPFRAWCSFCVQAISRGHYKHRSTPDDRGSRSFPTVQVDLFAMPNSMGVLLMVDVWIKYVGVELLRNKNAGVIGAILARYLSNLSYFDEIEVSYDNEPVLSAGVKMAASCQVKPRTAHDASAWKDVFQIPYKPGRKNHSNSPSPRKMSDCISGGQDENEDS